MSQQVLASSPWFGLAVAIEREQLCCDNNIAIIGAGTAMHAASLRCAKCGRHRGWLPAATIPFIEETIRHFGRPTEPIVLRTEHIMAKDAQEYDNTNRGVLFHNDRKESDKSPGWKGTINIDGAEYWLSAWVKTSKKAGEKYLSLAVRSKDSESREAKRSKAKEPTDYDDEINLQ
jgi:hypothetical protein